MNFPIELKYTDSHEWVKIDGNTAYIGITDHAQHELGDIVFVELPETGSELKAGDEATNIESVKAAAPIYSPLSGRISRVNEELDETPEKINSAPYQTFIFAVEYSDPGELEKLMDAQAYQELIQG